MATGIRLLSCFAVLLAAAFVQCSPLDATEEIFAGENTPVWIASHQPVEDPNAHLPIRYFRLKDGTVKSAVDAFKANSNEMRVRTTIGVSSGNPGQNKNTSEVPVERRTIVGGECSPNAILESWSKDSTVLYPSVLVVMDYHYFKTTSDLYGDEMVRDRIVYALSYWNSVDSDLKHIEHPRVPLRIAGIVITMGRDVTTYPYTNVDSMLDYWRNVAKNNEDFALGSFDIVAHMTDDQSLKDSRGLSTNGSPCNLKDKIGGVMVYDDLAFEGVLDTVDKMTIALAGDENGPRRWYNYERYHWSCERLDGIYDGLKGATCMSTPKKHNPPGKPVAPVLAAEILPRSKQCEAHGYPSFDYNCWTTTNWIFRIASDCEYMYCATATHVDSCRYSNPTLDGTYCTSDDTKICVSGKCVDK